MRDTLRQLAVLGLNAAYAVLTGVGCLLVCFAVLSFVVALGETAFGFRQLQAKKLMASLAATVGAAVVFYGAYLVHRASVLVNVGPRRRPRRGFEVTLIAPAGPMTDACAPRELKPGGTAVAADAAACDTPPS